MMKLSGDITGPFSAVCIQSVSSTQDLESLTWDHGGILCIVP